MFLEKISPRFKEKGGLLFSKRISPCLGGIQAVGWGGIGLGFERDSGCCLGVESVQVLEGIQATIWKGINSCLGGIQAVVWEGISPGFRANSSCC